MRVMLVLICEKSYDMAYTAITFFPLYVLCVLFIEHRSTWTCIIEGGFQSFTMRSRPLSISLLFSLFIHVVHSFHSFRLVLVDCGFWFYPIQSLPFLYKMRIVLNPSVCRLSKLSHWLFTLASRIGIRIAFGMV